MALRVDSAMTVRDVAQRLNVDEKTVYRLLQGRQLPGFKVAGTWRLQRADLERWIVERKREAAAPPASTRKAHR